MCSSTNIFDFSKIIIDTDLKFSGFTKLLTTYRMVYHEYFIILKISIITCVQVQIFLISRRL